MAEERKEKFVLSEFVVFLDFIFDFPSAFESLGKNNVVACAELHRVVSASYGGFALKN